MKMCIELKKGADFLTIQRELLARGFTINFSSSFGEIWIRDINYIFVCKDYIQIEHKELGAYDIKLNDIEYYEIHKDK